MLVRGKVQEALERTRDLFAAAAERAEQVLSQYESALDQVARLGGEEVMAAIGGVEWPGALPTAEWGRGLVIPFGRRWSDHAEAAAWARDACMGVTTVAIDGSQVAPSKEFAVPISLVQVAWFENPHCSDQPYVKDVRNAIVTPGDTPEEMEEYAFAESRLNRCRFTMEMEAAIERLERLDPAGRPVLFLDGSLILSFAGRMPPQSRDTYLDALFGVLETSERRRIPVVGYIDTSFASDLASMVRTVQDLHPHPPTDTMLLASHLDVFDRTAALQCARGDVLPLYRRADRDRSADILFVYLGIGPDRPPARIEFPRWVLEAGLLDRVIDIIRAEIVVGTGYPYALETADAAAVLTREDRMAFYSLFHQFASDQGLLRALPGKTVSKAHRR